MHVVSLWAHSLHGVCGCEQQSRSYRLHLGQNVSPPPFLHPTKKKHTLVCPVSSLRCYQMVCVCDLGPVGLYPGNLFLGSLITYTPCLGEHLDSLRTRAWSGRGGGAGFVYMSLLVCLHVSAWVIQCLHRCVVGLARMESRWIAGAAPEVNVTEKCQILLCHLSCLIDIRIWKKCKHPDWRISLSWNAHTKHERNVLI